MKKLIFIFSLLLIGCGYKPSTYYTSPLLGDKIYTQVSIDIKNPTDAIFLKDAVNQAVYSVFNAKLVSKNEADTIMIFNLNSVSISPIDYDKNGYPILYRASASLSVNVKMANNTTKSYSGSGSYDFSIVSNSVLSDDLKHNAIKQAFIKALQIIEFKIAQGGIDDNKRDK